MQRTCAPAILIVSFCYLSQAYGGFSLDVDFDSSGSPSETGFSSFDISQGSALGTQSATFGSTTITLSSSSGNLDSRDRVTPTDSGAFTYGELYRDFATTSDNNRDLIIEVAGLVPFTQYNLTFYAYDDGVISLSHTFTNTTGGVQPSTGGTIVQSSPVTFNSEYSIALNAVTDAFGEISFSESVQSGTSPRLNALQIAGTPEPTSFLVWGLLATLGGLVCQRIRQTG